MADQIQEIKDRTDIVELLSQYVSLKKAGKNYKGLCPFHSEKTPSFMVSPELQLWKCFGCGEGGDAFSFLMKTEGMGFGEALETLAQRAGVQLESYHASPQEARDKRLVSLNQLASNYFHYLLTKHAVGKNALRYLKEARGFSDELLAEFRIGYAPDSWDSLGKYLLSKEYTLSEIIESGLVVPREGERKFYDRFRARVMFPLRDHRGRFVGFSGRVLGEGYGPRSDREAPKYINTPETPLFRKGEFLYGLFEARNHIRQAARAIVVEGPTDLLTPFALGTKNIVASQGTALTLGQVRLLKRYCEDIAVCYDTDLAGDEATKRGITAAENAGLNVAVVLLPEGFKDPDDCARKDHAAWKKAVDTTVPIYDFYFEKALKRQDPKDPIGKKKISRELLPLIKNIGDDIERAHYIQKLANVLSTSEAVVEQALTKLPLKPVSAPAEDTVGAARQQNYPEREFYILALLFLGSLDHVRSIVHRLGKDDFLDERLRSFFVTFKEYLAGSKVFQVADFRARIQPDPDLVAVLEDVVFYRPPADDLIEDELEVTLAGLKRDRIRRDLKDLEGQIRDAEVSGDLGTVEKLQLRFKEVSSKLE